MSRLQQFLDSLDDELPISTRGESYNPNTNNKYRATDTDEFPIGDYFLQKTGRVINKHFRISEEYDIRQLYAIKVLNELSAVEVHRRDWFGTKHFTTSKIFEIVTNTGATLITVSGWMYDNYPQIPPSIDIKKNSVAISIHSNDTDEVYNNIINKLTKNVKIRKIEENQVHLVITTRSGYDTAEFDLPKQKLDIELNYGKGFKPIHNKILKELSKDKGKGLVLLHGTPGTGKTHYLKYLASKIKNKKVLFIPPYLADFITSPEMTPFLIENANSILFIEDAEKVITDRSLEGSQGVSNILNLTDGILSDILNIQIVATFNMDKKKIDSALLRKGRLIAEHKFDKLSLEETQKLINHLGYDKKVTDGLTLSEIYNLKEEEFKSEDNYMPKIGFGLK